MMSSNVVIVGNGGYARCIFDSLMTVDGYNFYGFVSKDNSLTFTEGVIGSDNELKALYNNDIDNAIIGIGYLGKSYIRDEKYVQLKEIGYNLPVIIDP